MGDAARILFIESLQLFVKLKLLDLINVDDCDNAVTSLAEVKCFQLNNYIYICFYYVESV